MTALPSDPTASEALAAAGYTHRPIANNHAILDGDGQVVARLKAPEVWAWLRGEQEEAA